MSNTAFGTLWHALVRSSATTTSNKDGAVGLVERHLERLFLTTNFVMKSPDYE